MIVVTFALPTESRGFRAALSHASRVGPPGCCWLLGNLDLREVLIVHTGVGPAAAARAIATLLAAQRPEFLIAAGFAGGLDPGLRTGDLVLATNLSTPALLAPARELCAGRCFAPLTTVAAPTESLSAKAALARATGAAAVDMESAPLAAACAAAAVPFLAIRAICDSATTALPIPFAVWFDLARQRPHPWALLRHLAHHPRQLRPFAHFVQSLPAARAALTRCLLRYLAA